MTKNISLSNVPIIAMKAKQLIDKMHYINPGLMHMSDDEKKYASIPFE